MLQWVAMATMLLDHIGKILYPDQWLLQIIGRIAFPLYAFGIVRGLDLTIDKGKYLYRLAGLAIISQLPYMWAFNTTGINVISSFFIGACTLVLLNRFKRKSGQVFLVVLVALLLEALHFDYGMYGLLLLLIYRYVSNRHHMVISHATLNIIFVFTHGWILQLAAILPTIIIAYGSDLFKARSCPRWLWRSFYPAHLLALVIV